MPSGRGGPHRVVRSSALACPRPHRWCRLTALCGAHGSSCGRCSSPQPPHARRCVDAAGRSAGVRPWPWPAVRACGRGHQCGLAPASGALCGGRLVRLAASCGGWLVRTAAVAASRISACRRPRVLLSARPADGTNGRPRMRPLGRGAAALPCGRFESCGLSGKRLLWDSNPGSPASEAGMQTTELSCR